MFFLKILRYFVHFWSQKYLVFRAFFVVWCYYRKDFVKKIEKYLKNGFDGKLSLPRPTLSIGKL